MSRSRRLVSAAVAAAACLVVQPSLCLAGDKLIEPDWKNAELQEFARQQAEAPRRSLGPAADSKLAKVKLPVIGFDTVPSLVQSTFRLGPKPETERSVAMDESNPVWYQITERYGDVTVSVEGDLRIHHEVGDDYPVYGSGRPGAAPQSGTEVSVFDEEGEEGMEGAIAEYTVTRFGIPYTVKFECTAEVKDQCRDTAQIAKDAEALKLLEANVPGQ